MASVLRIKAKEDGRDVEVDHNAAIRQCEWEYLDAIAEKVAEYPVFLASRAVSASRVSPSASRRRSTLRLRKSIEAGADFVQTQCIFNIPKFKKWMEMVRAEGRPGDQDPAGITPIKGAAWPGTCRSSRAWTCRQRSLSASPPKRRAPPEEGQGARRRDDQKSWPRWASPACTSWPSSGK